jgi:hypothetical protein
MNQTSASTASVADWSRGMVIHSGIAISFKVMLCKAEFALTQKKNKF